MSEGNDKPSRPASPSRPPRPAAPAPREPAAAPTPPPTPAPGPALTTPGTRPARPTAPTRATRPDANDGLVVIPQGLSLAEAGLSGIPQLQRPVSSQAEFVQKQRAARSASLRQTLLPSCLVLGLTLPLLAGGWFTLDRFSVLRDNALGLALPITLATLGIAFLAASLLLAAQSRRGPRRAD